MKVTTTVLDKVAFFTTFGAEIIDIQGKCPDNLFVIKAPGWLVAYESMGGWVPYNKFCNERRRIKRTTRKLAGLPENFTGNKDTGFKLGDIAMIRPKHQQEFVDKVLK